MKKRLLILTAPAAIALLAFVGCADKGPKTIKIGVAGAHTGDLASYGLPSVKAAELVVEEWNAKGGVCGKQIELLVEDDVCKPEVATNAATKLVSDKRHRRSSATSAPAPPRPPCGIYKEAKIVTMSPSATNPDLTQSGEYPNFFRTIASDDAQAKLEVEFAIEQAQGARRSPSSTTRATTARASPSSPRASSRKRAGRGRAVRGHHPRRGRLLGRRPEDQAAPAPTPSSTAATTPKPPRSSAR
ncbi:MAG: ABC transporter substrate-binding protein [Desulfomicrobium escambiense]|nr:ABC transporter substrate-binding protein [Desulfomicrobium escambiense]